MVCRVGKRRLVTLSQGVPASAYASNPAPSGTRWEFVTYLGARVTYRGTPVVTLVRI